MTALLQRQSWSSREQPELSTAKERAFCYDRIVVSLKLRLVALQVFCIRNMM
jgi:hypothetical protein